MSQNPAFKGNPLFFFLTKRALPWIIDIPSTSGFQHCLYYTLIYVFIYVSNCQV